MVFQAEDGIGDLVRCRGRGDVYKRQLRKQRPWRLWGKPYLVEKYRPLTEPIAYDAVQSMLASIGHKERFEFVVLAGGGSQLFKKAIHEDLPLSLSLIPI